MELRRLGLVLVFHPTLAGARPQVRGEALADAFRELTELAARRQIAGLADFADQRAAPPETDSEPSGLEDLLGPCTDWYDTAVGGAAFAALARCVDREPGGIPNAEAVARELREFARLLALAHAQGARFRLDVG